MAWPAPPVPTPMWYCMGYRYIQGWQYILTDWVCETHLTSDLWPQCSPRCHGGSRFPRPPLYSAERTTYTSSCPPHTPGSPCVWRTWQTSVKGRQTDMQAVNGIIGQRRENNSHYCTSQTICSILYTMISLSVRDCQQYNQTFLHYISTRLFQPWSDTVHWQFFHHDDPTIMGRWGPHSTSTTLHHWMLHQETFTRASWLDPLGVIILEPNLPPPPKINK